MPQQNAQPTQTAEYYVGNNADEPDRVSAYKRAGLPKDKLLKRYRMRLDTAKKWRKDEKYDETWKRLNDMYKGKHFDDGLCDEDRIAVNVAFSTVNVIVPSVAVNYPSITVSARQEQFVGPAEATEAMVNYWWKHYDWRMPTKEAVKDSLVYGHGWVKVGWKYESKNVEMTPEERVQMFQEHVQQASDAAAQNPEAAAGLPTDDEIEANLPTHKSVTVEDCPFVERVSPRDIYVDPEATNTRDWKWVAQRIVTPLETAQKDERYSKAARSKLQADASTNPRCRDDHADEKQKYDDDVKRVTLWEFYDVTNKFYCVFAEHGEGFLVEPTDFPYPYGVPFVYLGNYNVPDQFYDVGDLEMIEPLQAELNAVRSDMRNHRKRWQRAYMALRDKFSPEAMNTLMSDKDNRVVWIEGDENLSEILAPIQQIALDPQMYQYSDIIEQDVTEITGVSDYQRGSMSETRRTATEASIIQDSSNARAADKLATIESFIGEIAERVVELAQVYLTGEQVARIAGPDEAAMWVPFDITAIQGQFDYEVEAGSTQPKNEMFRRQQAMQLATVMQPFVGIVVDPNKLVAHLLKEGFGIKNPSDFMFTPEDQLLQQMAMTEAPNPEEQGETSPDTESAAEDGLATGLSGPQQGVQGVPPEVLTQLQGQVGFNP